MSYRTEEVNVILVLFTHVTLDKEGAIVFRQENVFHGGTFSQWERFEFLLCNDFECHFHEICLVVCLDQVHVWVGASADYRLQGHIETRWTEMEVSFVFLEMLKGLSKILSELWNEVNFIMLVRFIIETDSSTNRLNFDGVSGLFGLGAAAVVSHFCNNINKNLNLLGSKGYRSINFIFLLFYFKSG